MITDTHCHLDLDVYKDDLDEVINKPKDLGFVLAPGCDIESSKRVIEIANQFNKVYAAVGIHPIDAHGYNKSKIEDLRELSKKPKVLAIGEIGLDYHYPDNPDKELQKEAFRDQIELALDLELPYIVHDRESNGEALEIVKEYPESKAVFHAYSGDLEQAKELMDLGLYISVGGAITFKNPRFLPEVVKNIPLDRIMLETDGPYMSPVPFRGQRNEPARTRFVMNKIAELTGKEIREVEEITARNACDFFNINLKC